MPATPLSQSEITVKGPFWTARARVVTSPYLTPTGSTWGGADIPDVRAIFVEDEARAAFGFERVHLPGTLVALCYVESVTIQPDQGSGPSYQWQRRHDESVPRVESIEQMKGLLYGDEGRQAGQLSLLLLETDPDQVADVTFTCTAGEINLGVLQPQTNALKRLYRALDLEPVEGDGEESRWTAAVHSSGLSIYGKAELPWLSKDVGIAAPFQLARIWPDPATGGRNRRAGFRLTVEADRLTNSEAEALVAAWQTLSRYLSPRHPLVGDPNSPQQTPTWVTLETANPLVLPRLYWEIAPWQAEPESWPLHFERGQFIILLADQQPHDLNHRPTSLAQMVPDDVLITGDREKGLEIAVQAGPQVDQADRRLNYQWHREPSQEVCAFSGVEVAYNPTETPEFVRETQNLPIPEWLPGDQPATIKPAVVWGFMPLEDGWAQLPIPNLTEQVYLDAKVSNIGKEAEEKGSTLLRGAVSLGNEPALMWHRDEQPWNVTLVNLARAQGVWQLKADPDTGGLALEAIDLELSNPKLILNGLFWLGSGKPRVEDALPDLADWISGLQSVSLATMSDTDLFPPIVKLVLDDFSISSREREASSTEAASAVLTAWSFTYTVSQGLLSRMIDARVLPQKVFGQHPPLVWRRHPTLPMIQALPLTQSKLPPNYPNASRQLAPFELPLTAEGDDSVPLPTNWRFGVRGSNGAAQWPKLLDQVSPAVEWVSHSDLPLAALSLPGLTLAPTLSSEDVGLAEDPGMPLVVQYRFDLPYTDQLNALAQLPKVLGETEGPPPEPPKPLTRETLTEHWQTLSTRASLASADAIEAFSRHNGRDFILHLVEPYRWPVRPTLSLATYPGALAIENTNGDSPASITLEADVALKGISGTFTLEGEPGHLQRLGDRYNGNGLDYLVEAGSMAAHYDEERLSMRDQRGLMRQATGQTDGWLRTPVQLHRELDNIDSYELVSALQPVALRVTEEETWQFWVRDLPVEQASASFLRDRVRSSQAQDVNDPEALSREYNFLSGYEWRLGQDKAPHKLYGLDFYPLTLERATFKDDRLERVEIIGRLQLPLSNAQELEHLSNAVRVVFTAEAEEDWLRLSGVELETPIGEWPLVSTEGEAPRLEWKKISLNEDLKQLEVNLVWLRFFLFDVEWSLRLDSLVFGNGIDTAIEETYAFDADASRALYPEEATLQIDLKDRQHRLELRMVVQLGEHRVDDGLLVHYEFEAGEDAAMVYDVSGVGEPLNLTVQDPDAVSWLPGSGLAIHNPTRLISDGPATKIIDAVQASDEISIEAWIKPASTSLSEPQVPARIVTLSSTIKERNFSLQQGAWPQPEGDFYHVRLRTSEVRPDQEVPVATPSGSLTMELTHVVYTRDAGGVARLYLDGVQVVSQAVPGDLDNWNADFPLVLANELTDGRAWLGEFYQVSIYDRALAPGAIQARFELGPGALATRTGFWNRIVFSLVGETAAHANRPESTASWETARLFSDIEIGGESDKLIYTDRALQFSWKSGVLRGGEGLYLLPGMHIASDPESSLATIPGFATVTFDVLSLFSLDPATESDLNKSHPPTRLRGAFAENGLALSEQATILGEEPGQAWLIEDGRQSYHIRKVEERLTVQMAIPQLDLRSAFLEVLITSDWGAFLQDGLETPLGERVFGSSAGKLLFGYTTQWRGESKSWDETFLLNGFLEVKNLISWPLGMEVNEAETVLTLPAIDVGGDTSLAHTRHSLRLLFNQHQIPPDVLVFSLDESLVFSFAGDNSWQFLAVTEHQLVDVQVGEDLDTLTVDNDRRWAALQEVRLILPETLARFLQEQRGSEILAEAGVASYGYWNADVRERLATSELKNLPGDTLIVEASAPHWIRQEPVPTASATSLQFLPFGAQLGILSSEEDYQPSAPRSPKWLLVSMPFLGRLQATGNDGITSEDPTGDELSPLQIDPVAHIYLKGKQSPAGPWSNLALALANWSDRRRKDNLLVHYEFGGGEDAGVVYDVSGVGEPLNLAVQDPDAVSWLPGGGLDVHSPTRLISDGPATKIIDAVRASHEISIEAWIKPASTSLSEPQTPARIVTLSSSITERNFSLQQGAGPRPEGDFYHVRLRTSEVQPDQEVPVATPSGSLTMELTHVVYTRDAGGVARLYLDGVQVVSQAVPGDLDNWNADFPLVLANELTDGRAWLGEFYQVSIYERALSPSEVSRNFQQGVPGGSSPPAARLEAILPLDIGVSIFDSPVARTWPRLDPISLEENWFRLQNPVEEAQPAGVQSVTAARPTTPARLSRATALRRAFNAFRRVYPPARPNGELPAAPSEGLMVWRQNRLMVMQGAPTSLGSSAPPYGWHLTGLLIRGSHLSHRSESAVLRRYPAATLLPALLEVDGRENPLPVSFAVSPYLGLEYKAGQEGSPQLVSVELMCVDHVSGQLRPVASRFVSFDGRTGEGNLEKVQGLNMSWAREMHQRLTPESPVAVMRLRQINVDEDGALTTHYAFEIVDELQLPQKLAKRIFHVRSKVETLRFREGQFGGTHVPAQYWPFEIAPPLTTGVQPIYLKAAPETDIQHQLAWPWGLSALRVSIAYTQQAERDCVRVEKGVTGEISDAAIANGRAPTLWWQVPHHVVQYRSALRTNRTTAGLPDLFRAPAIRSMLPVLPDPPMPPIVASSLFSLTETELIKRWQPVLPGRLRYLLVGARAGVMFAVRNQLLRQVCSDPNPLEPQQGATLVSGSIPVQHRIPRPVPLPANEDPQHALQTWASYFEPTCNALVTLAPADEAFFAACDGRPAKRLRMVLREPNFGLLPNDWNGDLVFDIDPELDLLEEGDWGVTLQLTGAEEEYTLESVPHFSLTWSYAISDSKLRPGPVDEGLRQEFSQRGLELPKESAESEAPQLEVRPDPGYFVANIVYSGRNLYKLQREDGYLRVYGNRWRAKRRAALDLSAAATTSDGELILTASVTSNPPKGDTGASPAGFCQKLVFPLRLGDLTRPPLPLQPQFIHFEDPEYNRRLASSAALSNKNIRIVQKGDRKDYDLTLVADRKEYNPDSQVAILADWEPESDRPDVSLSLSLSRVDNTGNPTISDLQGLALEAGQLWSGSLADLTKDNQPLAFQPGNKVRIKVEVEGGKNATVEGSPDVLLEVDIVAEPVTPGPEAGYALLHAQSIDGHPEVECARFAWNPEPARIELVCAEDLKTEVVRRRAVFHWMHSSRPGRSSRYAIQKITHAGSTHFPQLDAS